jgi:hypothetical protein
MTFNREALKALLYAKRKRMGKASRRRPLKSTTWLYPSLVERRYAAQVRAWLRPLKDYILEYLETHKQEILRGDSADVTRKDAVPGPSYRVMINTLYGWAAKYIPDLDPDNNAKPPPLIFLGLGRLADSLNDFNNGQWQKSAKAALGVEFPVYEDWWPDVKKAWAAKNYEMISSSAKDYIKRVNQNVEMAVTNGWSIGQLTEAITKVSRKITQTDAARLARDQIGKLNGQTTQARMESLGLKMYEWMTAGDERVRGTPGGLWENARPSHYKMDGLLCRWDDPTLYSEDEGKHWLKRDSDWVQLHPGYDYNCRCTALSYWGELVGEVDAMIDKEEN